MARIVEGLETHRGDGDYGRFSDYPWKEWTDGSNWEVVHGEDFLVSLPTFRVYLYQWKDLINAGEVPQPVSWQVPSDEDIAKGNIPRWCVHTRIVAPGVIRFRFELDKSYEQPE